MAGKGTAKESPRTIRPSVQCPRCGYANRYDDSYISYHGRVRCTRCSSFFEVHFTNGRLMETPNMLAPDDVVLPSPPVPKKIQEDLNEAGLCFSVGALKATVVLCRRALEGAADGLSAGGRTLFEKIENIYERRLITGPVYEASTEIRVFGNYGAHPGKDLLEDIDEDLARDVLYFTREVVDDVYVKPGKLERLRKKRTQ